MFNLQRLWTCVWLYGNANDRQYQDEGVYSKQNETKRNDRRKCKIPPKKKEDEENDDNDGNGNGAQQVESTPAPALVIVVAWVAHAMAKCLAALLSYTQSAYQFDLM